MVVELEHTVFGLTSPFLQPRCSYHLPEPGLRAWQPHADFPRTGYDI